MAMLAPAQVAAYTNPPPMLATQHPAALMQNIYELYGTLPADPGFNYTGIDSRLVHELTLQQVVGQRVITQETEIVRRQLNTQLYGIRLLAPMRQVNALKIRFPYMEYNPALIGLVPERGRVRGTSFTQRVVEKQLERFAGGDHFGLEMLSSEIGPSVLAESRNTNLDATMITLEFSAWVEARRSQDIAWMIEKQLNESNITQHSMSVIESRAKLHWALFQLNPRALYHLNTKTQEYQSKYNGRGNAWFIHMKSERYLSQVPDERIQYLYAGPGGPNLLESMPGDGVRSIGGKPVFVMQNADCFGLGAMDVLENQAEYAEYYNMLDPFKDTDYEDYTSDSRSIHLVDCDRGCWERFTLMQALDASGRYNADGSPVDVLNMAASPATRDAFVAPVDQFDSCYYIASTGQQRLVSYMGQIEQRAFSYRSVLLLATSVVRRLTGLSVTPQQAMAHMNTLSKAVSDSHMADPFAPDVQAYIGDMLALTNGATTRSRDGLVEWKRNGSYGSFQLPTAASPGAGDWPFGFEVVPFGGNYAMLKALTEALRKKPQQNDFVTNYRLNYERATQIARALDVFDELARALERLLPGSALLKRDNASDWEHDATPQHVLFAHTIGESRLPLFVRAMNQLGAQQQQQQQQSPPPSQPASAASAKQGPVQNRLVGAKTAARSKTVPVDEARSQAAGLSTTYADDLMAHFTGRLTTHGSNAARSMFVQADLTGTDQDGSVMFDPRPAAGAKPYDAATFVTQLPEFARRTWGGTGTPAVSMDQKITVTEAGTGRTDRLQYMNLVRLLFNYRAAPSVENVDAILLAERNRAIALLIADAVQRQPVEEVAARFQVLFSQLLTPANGVTLKDNAPLLESEIVPIFGASGDTTTALATIKTKLSTFLGSTKQTPVFDQSGVQRIASQLPAIFNNYDELKSHLDAAKAAAEASGKQFAFPADSRFEASEYLRTPLTFGPSQFLRFYEQVQSLATSGNADLPYALPADPLAPSQPVPSAAFGIYAQQLQTYDPATPPALYDEKTVRRAATALRMFNHMSRVVQNTRNHDTYQEYRRQPHVEDLQVDSYGRILNWSSLTPVKEARAMGGAERTDVYSGRTYAELARDDHESEGMEVEYGSVALFQQMAKKATADGNAAAAASSPSDVWARANDIVDMVSVSFSTNWTNVTDHAPDTLTELVAKVYLCQKHHRRVFEAAYLNNTLFAKRFLLFRRARFGTLSALFAQIGGEAMETFITFPRFYYGSDPSTQEYEYSFHFWAGAVVKRPELLYWADHVQIIRYDGGWGMVPMRPIDITNAASVQDTRRSIYVYEEPYEPLLYQDDLPITGRRDDYSPKVVANVSENTSLLIGNAYAANLLFKWMELNLSLHEDESAAVPQERPWLSLVQNIFPLAHRGTARFYGKKQKFLHQSKGWFPSEIVTPRMVEVFNGALEAFTREDLTGFVPVSA